MHGSVDFTAIDTHVRQMVAEYEQSSGGKTIYPNRRNYSDQHQ